MVCERGHLHETILSKNGLNPTCQELPAYWDDIFLGCVGSAVEYFQNIYRQLAAGLRHSYDDAIESTNAVFINGINTRLLNLPHDRSVAKKKRFINESSRKAGKEASALKRKKLKGLLNSLPNSEDELLADRGRPKNSQQERLAKKEQIISGIRLLLKDNGKKLKRAAIARASGIANRGNMTQALDSVLEACEFNLEELIKEAKTSE